MQTLPSESQGSLQGKAPAHSVTTYEAAPGIAALCILQIGGISAAVVGAALKIESILASGPICSLLGFAVAGGWVALRSFKLLLFGLSAAAISLAVFVLINAMEWGPREAEFPVALLLLGYEMLAVPLGLFSLHEILVERPKNASLPSQFNLRTMLLAMSVAAVTCASIRLALLWGAFLLLALAIAMAVLTALGIVGVLIYVARLEAAHTNPKRERGSPAQGRG